MVSVESVGCEDDAVDAVAGAVVGVGVKVGVGVGVDEEGVDEVAEVDDDDGCEDGVVEGEAVAFCTCDFSYDMRVLFGLTNDDCVENCCVTEGASEDVASLQTEVPEQVLRRPESILKNKTSTDKR